MHMNTIATNDEGLTIRELRHVIGQFEETDVDGNEARIYIAVGNLHLSIAVNIMMDDDGDMILVPEHAQEIMDQLGTWDEFTSAHA